MSSSSMRAIVAVPLLAVFVLGLFVPRATSRGVFIGTWLGAGLTLFAMYRLHGWFAMWFFPIGFFTSVGISLVLSWLPFGRRRDPDEPVLTYWNVSRN